jgi:hypothetical protein
VETHTQIPAPVLWVRVQALIGSGSLAKRRPNVLFKLINSMETLRPPFTRSQTTIDYESMSGYPA